MIAGCAGTLMWSPVTILNLLALGPYHTETDISYGTGPRQRLDVYIPRHANGAPLVVFYYGGSWEFGKKSLYRFVGAALASNGVVVVIPDYRLYPQTRFPGFLQDSAAALAWAKAHAAGLGANPARLFVMGHSAGAYNAVMLALDPQWLAPFGLSPQQDIAGVIGLAGPYDFLPLTDPKLKMIFGPPDELARTQPINFVTRFAPPVFLAVGTTDTTVDPGNSARLAARLAQAGDEVTLKDYPGVDHRSLVGAISPLLGGIAPVLPDCLAFIFRTPRPRRSA